MIFDKDLFYNQSEFDNLMQTSKQPLLFKDFPYEIEINPLGERKAEISIFDSSNKSEYYERQLLMETIGVSTLIKAFQKSKKEINLSIQQLEKSQIEVIVIKVRVDSQFLKTVEQLFYIKKKRDLSDAEILQRSIQYISKKVKDLKIIKEKQETNGLIINMFIKEQSFLAGNTFQPFSEITLSKGKFLLTWTFLAKASNGLIYIYLNQGQVAFLTNCAIYVPNSQNFIPFTLRKVHNVTSDKQKLTLQTYCTASYPVIISNCIVTAKKIN